MKLQDGAISFLVNPGRTTIEIHDRVSGVMFAEIRLTDEQVVQMMSRLSFTDCDISVFGLDKIGKKMESASFEFELPDGFQRSKGGEDNNLNRVCWYALRASEFSLWEPQLYFGSQNSFFSKDGKQYARTVVRRWVEVENGLQK